MIKTQPLLRRAFSCRAVLILTSLFAAVFASAQYCSPTVNASGIYFTQVKFDYTTSIAGGQTYLSGSGGYTQNTASSSGTIRRYWGAGIWFNIQNISASAKTYHLKVFADWNNDGDFNDFLEDHVYRTDNLPANTNLGSGLSIAPPLHATGNIRIRFALAEGATAPTACGSFTGEVEDYILTIAPNAAPVINSAGTPFINNLLTSQTATEGFTIAQLLASASTETLATDGDDANQWQPVPRGLAIYSQTATNGTWQYKILNGAWTPFGPISSSNALLLMGNGGPWYQSNVRIRFVPSGTAGTASFSFRLWDGTTGSNGGYTSIGTTGGNTAFSNGTKTASVNVVSSLSTSLPVFVSGLQQKIFNTSLDRSNGQAVAPAPFIGTGDAYSSYDLALNPAGSKLYWISGENADRIATSNVDGSGLNTALIPVPDGVLGIAASATKVFYTAWTPAIFSANPDGTHITPLTGGAGQLSPADILDLGDIEFANNRIYFVYYSASKELYRIMSANADGTDLTEIHSVGRYIKGLDVTTTHVYWTEWDATATPEVFRVMKKPLTGGAAQALASQPGRSFNNLVADEANGVVYVIAADDIHSVASELRSVPVNGGSLTTLLSLEGQATALALKVSASTLPVTLLQYEARLLPNKTGELRWVTGNEQSVDHFKIEKSPDGRRFTLAGTVRARGTMNGKTTYTWTDPQVAAGDNYYRLSEVSPEGKTKELGIRRIWQATAGQLQLYPNPATGSIVTVNTGYAVTNKLTYQLLDATGRALMAGTLTQQYQQIDISKLPKGFYLLSLSDGQRIQFTVN